jgi:fatty acid desaturase
MARSSDRWHQICCVKATARHGRLRERPSRPGATPAAAGQRRRSARRTARCRFASGLPAPPAAIQHRFEHAQWMSDTSWGFAAASLGSTSYLRLPRLLQWFIGNIGFHHVHHVDPRIPNYRLEECHNADAGFQSASTLTIRTALQALRYALWDTDLRRLVPFRFVAASSRCLRRISQRSGD